MADSGTYGPASKPQADPVASNRQYMAAQEAVPEIISPQSSVGTSPDASPCKLEAMPRGRARDTALVLQATDGDADQADLKDKCSFLVFDSKEVANSMLSSHENKRREEARLGAIGNAMGTISTHSESEDERHAMFQIWMKKVKQETEALLEEQERQLRLQK